MRIQRECKALTVYRGPLLSVAEKTQVRTKFSTFSELHNFVRCAIYASTTSSSMSDTKYSLYEWPVRLNIAASTNELASQAPIQLIMTFIIPHIAFYIDMKNSESGSRETAAKVPRTATLIARCKAARTSLSQTEEDTKYTDLDHTSLYALAITRIREILFWSLTVVERFAAPDGSKLLYPCFRTEDEDEQLGISNGLLRTIMYQRTKSKSFAAEFGDNGPYLRMQECIAA